MNRRNLLKVLGISAVGLATVPLWMDSWNTDSLPDEFDEIDEDQKKMLTGMVDTIIPATDTPGARELGVDKFILTMVGDCFSEKVQKQFMAGFQELNEASGEAYDKDFMELSSAQREEVLADMLKAEKPEGEMNFVAFVKGLTVGGYMSSEYVMKNLLHYEQVPSRWNGSFPVEQSIYHNA
ncbi:gluconate 2-dehydrogenase subunit 3 family protein [Zunongwangia sp. F363]|uniref:Gluconate 2-dehydrogenase subunit 3 family protein n=1 Tax=Autumnicola tepida TaxID=3075595 RepID=A0ABU3C6S7_9FLAO|nr:gluconate 2-dehydrogenase subunit 3 family protein [Zunongwangia sp. F363]MDT0642051.1 gluconate 2-dehydrogenase subunit 3 family protein [Zunongwangia sp. F363]